MPRLLAHNESPVFMPIPDVQALLLPLLSLAATTERRVPEVEAELAGTFSLTEEERSTLLASGRQRVFHNRISWAKTYLVKAGLVTTPGWGRFVASEAGRTLLASRPERIDTQLLLTYPGFREFKGISPAGCNGGHSGGPEGHVAAADADGAGGAVAGEGIADVSAGQTPEEQIDGAALALEAALRGELLARIRDNSPAFFERVIIDLLVGMGYGGSHRNAAEQLGRTGDGGVDGVINEDRLGLDRVYIQAKRYGPGSTVGRNDVQAFLGSLIGFGATKGVFVTTSTFSAPAHDFARHLSQRVILIDGQRLADLMIEHDVGVRISRVVAFKRLDEDFFAEDD